MVEYKTEKEKIQDLEMMIHELKKKKLLRIEYIMDKSEDVVKQLEEIHGELKDLQEDLKTCELEEVRRYECLIKLLKGRKEVLTGFKQVLHEARLSLRLLMKEEDQLTFRKVQLGAGGNAEN